MMTWNFAAPGRREIEARDGARAVQEHERWPAARLENHGVDAVDLQRAASEMSHDKNPPSVRVRRADLCFVASVSTTVHSSPMTRKPRHLQAPRIIELPHWDAVDRRFRTLAGMPWAAWLDSAALGSHERFDILVADPFVTLRTRGATTEIARRDGAATQSRRPPLELLREELGERPRGSRPAVLRRSRWLLRLRLGKATRAHSVDRGRRHHDAGSRDGPLRLGGRRRSRCAAHVARRQRSRRAHVRELGRARCALVGGAAAGAAAVSRAWRPEVEPRPRRLCGGVPRACKSTFASAIAIR